MTAGRARPPAASPTRRGLRSEGRRLRLGARWLCLALALALLLAGAGMALLLALRAYAPSLTREQIEAALSRAIGQPVRVGEVIIRPWLGRLYIRDVTVGEGAGQAQEPMLRLGRAAVTVDLSSLWYRELVISRIALEDFTLRVAGGTAGPLVVPHLSGSYTLGAITVRVRTVRLEDGRIIYQNPSERLGLEMRGLGATVSLSPAEVGLAVQVSSLHLERPGSREELERLSGRGRLLADRLAIGGLSARWHGKDVRVGGDVRRPFETPELSLTVRGEFDLASVARLAEVSWPVRGLVTAQADVQGPMGDLRVSARASTPDLTAGPVRGRDVSIRGQWGHGVLRIDDVRARLFDGALQGSLLVRQDRPAETHARFTLKDASIPTLEGLLPTAPRFAGGILSLEADLTGDPRKVGELHGRASLEGSRLTLPGKLGAAGAGSMQAEVAIQGDTFQVVRAVGEWPGVRIGLRGGVTLLGPQALHVTLQGDLDSIAKIWGQRNLAGQAAVSAEVNGRWLDPEVVGSVQAPVVRLADSRVEHVHVPFHFLGQTLRVDAAEFQVGGSRVTVSADSTWSGDLTAFPNGFGKNLRFRLRVRAPSARLEDLDPWIPSAWRGSGAFTLATSAEGTPEAWQGAGTVDASSLLGPRRLPIQDLQGRFDLDQDRIEIRSLRARVRGVPISDHGTYAWHGTGRVDAEFGPADLGTLSGVPEQIALRGTGRGRLHVELAADKITGTGSLSLAGVSAHGISLGDGTVLLTLRGEELEAQLTLPQAGLSGTGRGTLGEAGALDLQLAAREVDLAPILAQALPEGVPQATGVLSASAKARVPLRDLAAVKAEVNIARTRFQLADEAWENRGPVVLRWEAGAIHVDRLQLQGRLGILTASGELTPSGSTDLRLDGQLPLAVLPALDPEIRDAAGKLEITVRIAGTASQPRMAGEGTIREGRLQLAAYPDALREVEVRFLVSPDGLRLVSAEGSLGRGRLHVSGDLGLDGWRPGAYQFGVKGQEVPVALADDLRTAWDLELEVVGRGPRATVSGSARLARGSYTGTFSLLSVLFKRNTGPPAASSLGLPLRVLLQLENDLVVRTDLARFRARGTLNLEGTTSNPVLFGTLEARDGQIVFRNHRFTLVSASARFDDPRRIDPELDVLATTQIKSYEVTLNLSGKSEDLSVRFSSTPPLPQEDLLTLVTFGVTRDQLGRAGPGLLLGEAAKLLAHEVLGVEPSGIGLDVLEVETGEGGERTLRVGKQVTEQARVIYSQALGASGERKIRIEYQVLGPVLLAGEQNFQGGYGGDLILRLRFR